MPIATRRDIVDLSSENKTEELANKISKKLKPGDIVFLNGEMGVGKTTFVKYLINGFQKEYKLKQTEVTSPTFNLLNEYKVGDLVIKHYDLFRLKNKSEFPIPLNSIMKNNKIKKKLNFSFSSIDKIISSQV